MQKSCAYILQCKLSSNGFTSCMKEGVSKFKILLLFCTYIRKDNPFKATHRKVYFVGFYTLHRLGVFFHEDISDALAFSPIPG